MMVTTRSLVAVLSVLLMVTITQCSEEALAGISAGFHRVYDECRQELNLGDHIVNDIVNFWKEEYALVNKDLGCALICMSKKLNLLDADGKIHHGSAKEYALKSGADEAAATKLLEILHQCEKESESITDQCAMALEIAKCFRTSIQKLNWTPNMEVAVVEVLTDI